MDESGSPSPGDVAVPPIRYSITLYKNTIQNVRPGADKHVLCYMCVSININLKFNPYFHTKQ